MDNIKKQFELLKTITPDAGFVAESRKKILGVRPRLTLGFMFRTQPVWARALGAGVAVFALILGGFALIPSTPNLSSLQNAEALAKEAETLPGGIELQAVSYQEAKNETIKTAIAEIGDKSTRHLKENLIETEMNSIQKSEEKNTEIDNLLDSVVL